MTKKTSHSHGCLLKYIRTIITINNNAQQAMATILRLLCVMPQTHVERIVAHKCLDTNSDMEKEDQNKDDLSLATLLT